MQVSATGNVTIGAAGSLVNSYTQGQVLLPPSLQEFYKYVVQLQLVPTSEKNLKKRKEKKGRPQEWQSKGGALSLGGIVLPICLCPFLLSISEEIK